MSKLRITMVSGHACIRVHKMAIPLIERGHTVRLIANKLPSFWEQYKSFMLCSDVEQYLDAIRLAAPETDVFHAHNEPSWFVTAIKETCGVPVILDVHDSFLARTTAEEAFGEAEAGRFYPRVFVEERNNFQLADGLVYPGEHFADTVRGEFNLIQPDLVLPSYVPRRFYQYEGREWLGGLVYEGKVNLPSETKGAHRGFKYCDYLDLAKKAHAMGMDFHLYAGRDGKEFSEAYKPVAFVHKPMVYDDLMKYLPRHDWGLVGNLHDTVEWQVAYPNKLFEYLAAGVPVVAINAGNCAEFLEDTGFGIAVKSLDELGARWSEHTAIRRRLLAHRAEWAMDAHIGKLETFYRQVLHACR